MECEQDLSNTEIDEKDILKKKCKLVKILLEQKSRLEKKVNLERNVWEASRLESRRLLAYSSGSESGVIDCGEKPIIRNHKKTRPSSYPIYLRPGMPECQPRRRYITKKQWILAIFIFLLFACALYYAGVFFGSESCITCKKKVVYY